MSPDYFYWSGNPVLTDIAIPLPFEISTFGLLFGVLAYFGITSWMFQQKNPKPAEDKKSRKRKPATTAEETVHSVYEIPVWQHLAIFAGAVVLIQFIVIGAGAQTSDIIGPLQLRWYGLLFASAFLTGYFITRELWKQAGRDPMEVDSLLMYVIIATVVGARLGEVFFYEFSYYMRNPIKIFYIWEGGLASHGASIGILTSLWIFAKKNKGITLFWLIDRVTMPVILGGAFIRMGNFFNSEIYGKATEVSWAVVFMRIDLIPRHPTMVYEAIGCILIFILLFAVYRYYKNHPPAGALTGIIFIALFTFRFFIEFTKDQSQFSPDFAIGMGQLLSIPFVIFGIWLLVSKVDWKTATQHGTSTSNPQKS